MAKDRTNIQVYLTTKDRLMSHGKMGQTYDDVILDMLDKLEKN